MRYLVVPRTSSGGGGGDLVHGQTFTVTGTGFGSKSGHDHRFDDCTGVNVTDIWDYRFPFSGTGALAYRSAQRSVPLPHSHVSKYMCANHAVDSLAEGRGIMFGVDFTKVNGSYSRWEWLHRLDPAWVFDSPSFLNNHKWYGVSVGSGSPYADGINQWYIEFRGGGDFASTSGTFQFHVNDDAAGVGIDNWGNTGDPFGNLQPNPFTGWVRRSLIIRWNSSSSGRLWCEANQTAIYDKTEMTDGYGGTDRSEAIEGYAGNYNSNNWRYMSDIYYDRGANDAALYVTNNASWASSTIRVIQPWTAWSSTSITPRFNQGSLPAGTVHLHIRSFASGDQYLGTRTV